MMLELSCCSVSECVAVMLHLSCHTVSDCATCCLCCHVVLFVIVQHFVCVVMLYCL